MRAVLASVFSRLIRHGQITVYWPGGGESSFGSGAGPIAAMRLRDPRTVRRLALNPGLAFGEAYMDGGLVPAGCDIRGILELLIINLAAGGVHPGQSVNARARKLFKRLAQFNPAGRARRNAAHHYDLHHDLYSLFLDRDMQYSCAYFPRGDETLEEAQEAKKRHIAAKLLLEQPGLRVLDLGCGWGGLALTLARDYGARVTGITLSAEQLAVARSRAQAAGLADRVSFQLRDYRSLDECFDRIVSVGMFEHVGVNHYTAFFDALRRCLSPDGVALLHHIGSSAPPSATNTWLAKYIFPGGYSPSLSEVLPHIERSGLITTDLEVLRLHYAKTLQAWQQRFATNRAAIARLYDERFCRMFEFYLAGCELAFQHQGEVVFQLQLTRSATAVPLTRSYIADAERPTAPPTKARKPVGVTETAV